MHFGPTEISEGIFAMKSLRQALFSAKDTDKLREALLEIYKDGVVTRAQCLFCVHGQ